jgi:sigma-B regulation protein RsbU (phosphoserine phosphatase)
VTQPSGDRLALLYRVSQTFNSSLDLDEVLNCVIDEVIAAVRAERGFLMLRNAAGDLVFRAARGIDQQTIDKPEFQISRGVVERVAQEGRPLLTSNAQGDDWLKERTSVVALGLRSILCAPLQLKSETIGVIYVDNRLQAGLFTDSDLELLTFIAASAAVAIDNARLYQVAVEKGRLEHELQVARQVQASLLPHVTPEIDGWKLAARWQPARQVAGDFYDFVPVTLAKAEGSSQGLAIVIADVSDKGMPSALFMALSRSIVRASLGHARPLADSIAQANRLICADASKGMFVTLFCAQIDLVSGEMVYVNAGHNPPLLFREAQAEPSQLANTGMALGFFESAEFEQRAEKLASGDFVMLYTDGVTEAMDAEGREFGEERLERILLEHRRSSAGEMAAALDRALADFTGAVAPFDDITFVIAKRI